MTTKDRLAFLIYGMTNAVLFGVGIVPVLSIPSLNAHAWTLIPAVVVASVILAWPIALWITPRLRARFGRGQRSSGDEGRGRP